MSVAGNLSYCSEKIDYVGNQIWNYFYNLIILEYSNTDRQNFASNKFDLSQTNQINSYIQIQFNQLGEVDMSD